MDFTAQRPHLPNVTGALAKELDFLSITRQLDEVKEHMRTEDRCTLVVPDVGADVAKEVRV